MQIKRQTERTTKQIEREREGEIKPNKYRNHENYIAMKGKNWRNKESRAQTNPPFVVKSAQAAYKKRLVPSSCWQEVAFQSSTSSPGQHVIQSLRKATQQVYWAPGIKASSHGHFCSRSPVRVSFNNSAGQRVIQLLFLQMAGLRPPKPPRFF